MTACIGEQPPANVCTHLLFPLSLFLGARLQPEGLRKGLGVHSCFFNAAEI